MSLLFIVFLIINIFFAFIIIFLEHKNPAVTWSWIMVLIFIPYFGFILYLILGLDGKNSKPYIQKHIGDKRLLEKIYKKNFKGLEFLNKHTITTSEKNYLNINDGKQFENLVNLNFSTCESFLSDNNIIKTYNNGNDKFEALLKDIYNAKRFIHMEYYIVRNDNVSNKIINALANKAKQGVEVKFITDRLGSFFTSKKHFKRIINAGGEVAYFSLPSTFSMNFRNHRKLAVIDGKIGYIGGFNIGDEYLGEVKRFGNWRDSHIRIMGDSVKQMEIRFIQDWNFILPNSIPIIDKYFPLIEHKATHFTKVQIVSSGPDTHHRGILHGFFEMITSAKKSIYIQTPYFVPDDGLLQALRIAALSGINVTIVIPGNPDHPFVFGASMSYVRELILVGAKCYKYTNGFLHSKIVVVDGAVTSIGSANVDIRSFSLNFEINAFIYSNYISKKFIRQIQNDIKESTEITIELYNNRSRGEKIKEAMSRLLAPLL